MRTSRFRRGRGSDTSGSGSVVPTLYYANYTDAAAVVHSVPNKFTRITNGIVYTGLDYLPADNIPVTVFS